MVNSVSILLVEDDAEARQVTAEMLEVLGYRVESVVTAEEALALVPTRKFDVLLADINLPGMSGIDLAKMVTQILPAICVIFVSGYGYLLAEKTDFKFTLLPKPYRLAQLEQVLEENIGTANDRKNCA